MRYKFRVKYGQNGLYIRFRYGKNFNNKKDIILSKDYDKIFKFLKLDYNRYNNGFDSLEEIFEFVSKSELFNPAMYQLKALNKINRDRNLKRKSYMSFLEWLDKNYDIKELSELEIKKINESNNITLQDLNEIFPEANLKNVITELNYKHTRKEFIKQKFNGRIIMEITGLEGKELGGFIEEFKAWVIRHKGDFDEYVIGADVDNVRLKISNFNEYFYNQNE